MNVAGTILQLREKTKWLLSQKWMGAAVVLTSVFVRIIQQVYFFNTRNDMTYQVLGMQHLLEGNGISMPNVNTADISAVIYQPLNQWPPGFSLLLLPFYLMCGKNYIAAALMLGIACSILLIFITRAILKLTGVPYYLINLFTLVTGFFSYYFYTMPCTDAVGISFLITAFYFALRILKGQPSFKTDLLLLCLLLTASGFTKYLFIPAVFIISVFLFLKGMMNKSADLKKAGLYSFASLVLIFGVFFIVQKTGTGSVGYIKEAQRGFYPENLQSAFPFITGAIVRPDTGARIFPEETNKGKIIFIAFQIMTLLAFTALAFFLLKRLIKSKLKNLSAPEDFAWLSFAVSVAIISVLFFLSLRVGKESFDFGQWTYVQEPRYYGVIIVFAHLGLFIFYAQQKIWTAQKRNLLFGILLLLMLPEITRGISFTANRILKAGKETYGWQQELSFQKAADAIIRKIKAQQPENTIVLAGTSDWMILRVSLYSHLPAFADANLLLKAGEIKTSKPATLLAMIAEDKKEIYKSFISLDAVKEEGSANGFLFYSFPVNP